MRLDVIRTQPARKDLKSENEALCRQLEAMKIENKKLHLKLENARLQWKLENAKKRLYQLHVKHLDLLARKHELEVTTSTYVPSL